MSYTCADLREADAKLEATLMRAHARGLSDDNSIEFNGSKKFLENHVKPLAQDHDENCSTLASSLVPMLRDSERQLRRAMGEFVLEPWHIAVAIGGLALLSIPLIVLGRR